MDNDFVIIENNFLYNKFDEKNTYSFINSFIDFFYYLF